MAAQILCLGVALKRVVVEEANASAYAQSIQRLLTLITQREITDQGLAPQYQQTFLSLVKSTAWQESCWRQFIRVNGHVRFLESDTADVGLMQVNKHVWRGFYSLRRLEWDVVYNTSAGAEILMRLMHRGAEHKDIMSGEQLAAIARSTYSAYNGGPGAYNRWQRHGERAQTRQIDRAFWTKYQAMSSGQSFDILQCAMQWDTAPGH